MPIYVGGQSADVWANQHLFELGPDGAPTFVSGVPPDLFSATGQLWGSPLFDWQVCGSQLPSMLLSCVRSTRHCTDKLHCVPACDGRS